MCQMYFSNIILRNLPFSRQVQRCIAPSVPDEAAVELCRLECIILVPPLVVVYKLSALSLRMCEAD
jgi:hypothetical protein